MRRVDAEGAKPEYVEELVDAEVLADVKGPADAQKLIINYYKLQY